MSQTMVPGKMVTIKTSGRIYPPMEVTVVRPPYKSPKECNTAEKSVPVQNAAVLEGRKEAGLLNAK